jgi:hypothetical protein
MDNEELYDAALKAITDLFSDQSVSQSKARENLRGLRDEIDMYIDSLEE